MESLEFYRQLAEALGQGAIVKATVVQVQGSTPREIGASLFLTEAGELVGTIGGGAGEAKVLDQARAILAGDNPQWVVIDLTGSRDRQTQGVCGGVMQLWLDRWGGAADQAIAVEVHQRLVAGQSVQLVTQIPMTQISGSPLSQLPNSQIQPPQSGSVRWLESSNPESQTLALSQHPQFRVQCYADRLIEVILPPPLLLVVGAGHVGSALAQVAQLAGFCIGLVDDRPELLQNHNFQPDLLLKTPKLTEALAQLKIYPEIYVALVTRGVQQDLAALEILDQFVARNGKTGDGADQGWPSNLHYLGMIGSQRRINWVRQVFRDRGLDSEILDRLHAPIGIEIGALTPAEIAISICAELIQVRRSRYRE